MAMAAEGAESRHKNSTRLSADRLRIVLCGTTHPGNIGGAARAMKAMGISRLCLVAPKAGIFPSEEATARAVNGAELLASAQVFDTLADAVADCVLVAGTTARLRTIGPPVLNPREFFAQAPRLADDGDVALVFGRERTGLSNEEVDLCQQLIRIPTGESFASLNLAAAVQIMVYEWIQSEAPAAPAAPDRYRRATADEREGYYGHLQRVVEQVGFFAEKNQAAILRRLRQVYQRAELDTNEINILRGFLADIERALKARD